MRRSRYRKPGSARCFRRFGKPGDPPNGVIARNNGPAAPLRRRDLRVGEKILKLLSRPTHHPIALMSPPNHQLSWKVLREIRLVRSVGSRRAAEKEPPVIPSYLPPELDRGVWIALSDGSVADDTKEAVLADRTAAWKIERSRALVRRCEVLQSFAVARGKRFADLLAPCQCQRTASDARFETRDDDGITVPSAGERFGDIAIVVGLQLRRGVGEARDRLACPRVDLGELRHDVKTNSVTRELERCVSWIRPRTDSCGAAD